MSECQSARRWNTLSLTEKRVSTTEKEYRDHTDMPQKKTYPPSLLDGVETIFGFSVPLITTIPDLL
jgi:hypothetical protein